MSILALKEIGVSRDWFKLVATFKLRQRVTAQPMINCRTWTELCEPTCSSFSLSLSLSFFFSFLLPWPLQPLPGKLQPLSRLSTSSTFHRSAASDRLRFLSRLFYCQHHGEQVWYSSSLFLSLSLSLSLSFFSYFLSPSRNPLETL